MTIEAITPAPSTRAEDGSRSPVRVELAEGVLQLIFDTPGSTINVFTRATALRVRTVLAEVDPAQVRAVVLRSAKPKSFVNGVGLMLASAVKREEDVARLTADVRAAYHAIRDCPVPTIAAIRGACFGCGVELALQCDLRIAADDLATQFYMTEIAEYLFVPCFGATQEIPRLVGLESAADLVLWGRRWSAADAAREGLVDAVVDHRTFDSDTHGFVRSAIAERRRARTLGFEPSARETAFAFRTRRRIDALPPAVRPAYRECWELLERASRTPPGDAAGYQREIEASARTLLAAASKRAQGFFFVRQSAEALQLRGHVAPQRWQLRLAGHDELAGDLRVQRPADVELIDAPGPVASEPPAGTRRLALASPEAHRESADFCADALLDLAATGEPRTTHETMVMAWSPFWASGVPFAEIALPRARVSGIGGTVLARDVADVLGRAGFRTVITRPAETLASEALLRAFLRPLATHLDRGGSVHDAAATLNDLGFVRPVSALAAMLFDRRELRPLLDALPEKGAARPELGDAVLLSLLDFARTSLAEGIVSHPTVVDVLAREVLDFPLALSSLCRWLDTMRVTALLDRAESHRELHAPSALETARRYVAEGRSFYA